ncbi:MAG: gamma-glutamyltransferase [Ignavibacteria bacterium RBG_16_34_14]|nr:MAG: gamma-glutamyltransferase [Ignavibacteria bacterium RBG_16_34_14]
MQIFSKKLFSLILLFSISNLFSQLPSPYKNGEVVSANMLASQVGVEVLKKGGNAVDAAVAVGFALAVTYPSAGNLGGGGFMVIHLADGKETTIDYREKAPMNSNRNMYLDGEGNYIPELSNSGVTSVGVPGSVAGLLYALEKYGTLSLAEILEPAIKLAEEGFILDYHTARSFSYNLQDFSMYKSSMNVFSKGGRPYEEGDRFFQPNLAWTLKQLKEKGRDGFYKGKTAELFVDQIQKNGGYITFNDLEVYKPIEREPIKGSYRGYKIISMGPPSSGGVCLIQLLNILENYSFAKEEWGSSSYIHKLVEAMKYVYADRSKHLGDPDFYKVPVNSLLSKEYAKEIFKKIKNTATPSSEISPSDKISFLESNETTHYSVYDSYGNAVSTTTTINSSYGNKIVVDGAGFLMNNEMDDFSSKPGEPNIYGLIGGEANAIEPGKRMLSSMAPTIILKEGKPYLILGSPGGSTIITVVLQVVLNCLDFGMNIKKAIDMPRIHHQWLPDSIDYEPFALTQDVKDNLIKLGHKLGRETDLGRVEGIMIDDKNLIWGETDPRGYGGVSGY